MPLARAQERVRRAPASGWRSTRPTAAARATIGGILATGDCGPLRHRYGGPRDLILGVRVALPDGTVARAGSDVIKNVAGYDLAKLHVRRARDARRDLRGDACACTRCPSETITVARPRRRPERAGRRRPGAGRAGRSSSRRSISRWDGPVAGGAVLARAGGADGREQRGDADAPLVRGRRPRGRARRGRRRAVWAEQRARQRAAAGRRGRPRVGPSRRARAPARGSAEAAVGARRASASPGCALAGDDPERARAAARGARARRPACSRRRARRSCAPRSIRGASAPARELELLRRVKPRFDPAGVCNPRPLRGRDRAADAPPSRHPSTRPDSAWDDQRPPDAGADRRLRPLRLLPADLPDLRRSGARRWTRRAGRIALMALGHEQPELSEQMVAPLRPLPRLHGLRDRLPVRRPVRPAARRDPPQVERNYRRAPADRAFRPLIFALFPHPGRLRALVPALVLNRRLRLDRLIPGRFPRLRAMAAMAPAVTLRRRLAADPGGHAGPGRASAAPSALLQGCVQRVFFADVNRATVDVLARRGLRGPRPAAAALLRVAGDAHRLRGRRPGVRARDDRRLRSATTTVIVNAAGCGSGMKEYGHLLGDDRGRRVRRARPRRRTSSWPAIEPRAERHPVALRVAYHDACHLAHAQGIRDGTARAAAGDPRARAASTPAEWEICCGSAGVYNLLQPRRPPSSAQRKAANLAADRRRRRSPPPTPAARSRSPGTSTIRCRSSIRSSCSPGPSPVGSRSGPPA